MKNDHPLFAGFSSSPIIPPSKEPPTLSPVDSPKHPVTMTVSETCDLLEDIIEKCLPYPIQIRGEITNWKIARSGHAYFSLRDDAASIECVMWKRELEKLDIHPSDGMKVVAVGTIRVYKPRGQVNFQAATISLEGRGELEFRYRELCQKLLTEGLFAPDRKKRIPQYPMRIGLVTSNVGDALFDVITTSLRRFPPLEIIFVPVRVQGDGAAADIIRAIHLLNENAASLGPIDVILLVRGGGSLEDLWAFNDEKLARTIAASRIPIATGIGHEPDRTIADLVADAFGATPTGIAQNIVGEMADVEAALDYCTTRMAEKVFQTLDIRNRDVDASEGKMEAQVQRRLSDLHRLLDRLKEKINSIEPSRLVGQKTLAVENTRQHLASAMQRCLAEYRPRVEQYKNKLFIASPLLRIERVATELNATRRELPKLMQHRIRQAAELCRQIVLRLNESHPDNIIQRGFSITTLEDGSILKSVANTQPGIRLITRLADGSLISEVEAVNSGRDV